MPRVSSQRGFAPVVILVVVALVVAGAFAYMRMSKGSNDPAVTPDYSSASPAPAIKVDTTVKSNIAQSTESAAPAKMADEAVVADYLVCPSYSGEGAIAYPPFPATGPAPLTVLAFAGGTVKSGSNDSITGYDWDFDADGKWDVSVSKMGVQYNYTKAGTFTPVFRVRATSGKVSKNCTYPYPVKVDKGVATSDALSVNRSTATVNLYRANPNTAMMQGDNAAYSSGYLYGEAFTLSMLKADAWQLVEITGSPEITFDQTEREGAVGESFRVHVVVADSVANGSYSTTGKLQYFKNGIWNPFTTISLTVNVAN